MAATNVKWAVLTCLRRHSTAHGYWVYSQIGETFPTWGTSKSTVYDHLDRLERDGLIEEAVDDAKRTQRSRGSRGRTTYRLTEHGAQTLDDFLSGLNLVKAPSEYFVLSLLCATWEGLDVTVKLLDDLENRVIARLDEIRPAPRPNALTELGGWALVKDEQHALNARLTWIETMRQATQELSEVAGSPR